MSMTDKVLYFRRESAGVLGVEISTRLVGGPAACVGRPWNTYYL